MMNTKLTIAIVGAVVGLAWVTNAVMAQQAAGSKPRQEFKGPVKVFILAGQSNMEGHGGVKTLDRLGEHPTHGYLLKKQLKDKPESADPKKMEQLVKEAGDRALEEDAAYQQAEQESDRHVCNWYCHYQGSARVYCMVGYSLAEVMKPLLTAKP
jgi:hypothetical protein